MNIKRLRSVLAIASIVIVGAGAYLLSLRTGSGLLNQWLANPGESLLPFRQHYDVFVDKWTELPDGPNLAKKTFVVWSKLRKHTVGVPLKRGTNPSDAIRMLDTVSRASGIELSDLIVYFVEFVELDKLPPSFSGRVTFTERPSGGIRELLFGRKVCSVVVLNGEVVVVDRGRISW